MQKVQPQIVHKGPLCVLWDGISIYEIVIFKNYRKLHVSFVFTKTGTKQCYLGANTWCGYYCLMTASSLYWINALLTHVFGMQNVCFIIV